MTAKISPRHRRVFLQALAETGNVTLAADQVRVSKDWAYKLRRRDAAFDAACREAVAAAREGLRKQAGNSREERWIPDQARDDGPLHHSAKLSGPPPRSGEELVVQRGNGRRVQVKRARPGQWTRETEQGFLAALMATCNVQLSAAHVGKSAFAAYYHRRRDPGFAARWDRAIELGYGRVEAALIQNACHFLNPIDEPVPDQLLDGMSVAHAIDIARMNWGKVRRLRERDGEG